MDAAVSFDISDKAVITFDRAVLSMALKMDKTLSEFERCISSKTAAAFLGHTRVSQS